MLWSFIAGIIGAHFLSRIFGQSFIGAIILFIILIALIVIINILNARIDSIIFSIWR